jgi:hypothetical protein
MTRERQIRRLEGVGLLGRLMIAVGAVMALAGGALLVARGQEPHGYIGGMGIGLLVLGALAGAMGFGVSRSARNVIEAVRTAPPGAVDP